MGRCSISRGLLTAPPSQLVVAALSPFPSPRRVRCPWNLGSLLSKAESPFKWQEGRGPLSSVRQGSGTEGRSPDGKDQQDRRRKTQSQTPQSSRLTFPLSGPRCRPDVRSQPSLRPVQLRALEQAWDPCSVEGSGLEHLVGMCASAWHQRLCSPLLHAEHLLWARPMPGPVLNQDTGCALALRGFRV